MTADRRQRESPRSRGEIAGRIRELIVELSRQPIDTPAAGSRLEHDLNFDSLDRLELAVAIEQEFDLPPIPEEATSDLDTVGEIEALVFNVLRGR